MCFRGGGTHITRDICFPDGGSHITRDMCFPGGVIMWLADASAFTHPTCKATEKCPGDKVAALSLSMCQTPVFPLAPHMIFVLFLSPVLDPVCIFLPPVPHPCLPSHLTCIFFFYYFHQLQHSHLYLPSLCATSYHALYFVFFILITLITSYTLYVSPLLCALLYRHFPLSFPFSLLGPLLLCFFFCSKHQGRVVQSRVKMTQG